MPSEVKERSLGKEFDDDDEDEDDEDFSRDGEGTENFRANLRLKNSEVNNILKMHMPVVYPTAAQIAKQGAHTIPFHLDES